MKFIDKLNYNNETYEIRDTSARDILTEQGEQLAETSATVQGHSRDINNLKTRMSNAETAILENTADISEIEDAIDDIDTDISNIRADITEINGTLDAHASDISDIQSDISDIKSDITDINGDITVINGNITTINESIDALATVNAQQSAAINRNTQDITQLKQRATTAESRLDGIDNRLDGIDDDIEDLNDRIVASTYEAGEGIYFGQGEEHTNINVEDELLDEIHGNTQAIEDLGDRVDTLEERVDDIADDVTDLKSDVTQIQGDITTIQGDITNIQGDITQISGDITTIQGDITTIQNAITLNEEDIAKLKNSAKCNIVTVEYTSVGGVETYECHTSAADIAEFIREYKANSAGAQGTYIDHKDIIVNVSQGPYSYPDNVGIINNYSKPLFIYTTAVDQIITFINNADWNDYNNDSYELVSLILHSDNTIEFQSYNWNSKLYPIQQAVQGMSAQVQANTNALNTLTPQVSQNTTNITNLQTSVAALDTDITNIQGDITNIQGDITDIQGDITQLQGDMTTAQSDITSAQTDITGLRSDVTALQGDMTTAQGDITQLQSNMTTAQGDITTLQTNTTANILPVTIVSAEAFTLQTGLTSAQIETMAKDLADNNKPVFVEINNGVIAVYRYKVTDVHFTANDRRDGDLALLAHYHRPSDQQINTYFIKIRFYHNQSPTVETKLTDSFYDMFKIVGNVPGNATIQTAAMVKAIYDEAQATDINDVDYIKWACQCVIGTRYQWTIPKITKHSNMVYVDVMYIENALNHYYIHAEIAADYSVTYSYMLDTDLKRKQLINEMAYRPMNDSNFNFNTPGVYYEGKYYTTAPEWMPSDVALNAYHYAIMKVTSSQKNEGETTGDIFNELEFRDIPGVFYRRVKPSNSATWGTWYKFTGTAVT